MSFPDTKFDHAGPFAEAYFRNFQEAAATVDGQRVQQAADILIGACKQGSTVYSCGNGGSAAIANHLVCDHGKFMRADTDLTPRVVSLSATVEMITAIGNDLSYDDIFLYQLRSLARPGDVLVTVSASGDSENVVNAARWASENGVPVISMTGFSGGRSAAIADVNLHVAADNFGVVEDVHQSLMHILTQYLRQAHMPEELIQQRWF